MAGETTVWCPSCGTEYRPDVRQCPDCRVALVPDEPASLDAGDDGGLVELGEWPRVQAQVLRRRLETAGVSVMIEWSGPATDSAGILLVPEDQAEFGAAVVNEIDVDDEVADDSPHAYVARVEEHLSAAAGLLAELRRASTSSRPAASSDRPGAEVEEAALRCAASLRPAAGFMRRERWRSVFAKGLVARCPVVREVREERPPRHGQARHDEPVLHMPTVALRTSMPHARNTE